MAEMALNDIMQQLKRLRNVRDRQSPVQQQHVWHKWTCSKHPVRRHMSRQPTRFSPLERSCRDMGWDYKEDTCRLQQQRG